MTTSCPDCARGAGLSRREVLRLGGLAVTAAGLGLALPTGTPALAAEPAPEVFPGLRVAPRATWAGDLAPTGPMEPEAPGDVRFLLVHHTASGNGYAPDEVGGQLRAFFRFHTGEEKGWPDIAYNFLVDRYGGVWEGRAGSLEAPVRPDATGGSQGFAQLACFIGDTSADPPTAEAAASMVRLLAWLADRYGVDTAPGATATFVSRGSNRHPVGATVQTPTLAGHRDMSQTTCPGEAAYALVRGPFPAEVTALLASLRPVPAAEPAAAPAPEPPPGAPVAPAPATQPTPAPAPPGPPGPVASSGSPSAAPSAAAPTVDALAMTSPQVAGGIAAVAAGAATAGLVWGRHRRRLGAPPDRAPEGPVSRG